MERVLAHYTDEERVRIVEQFRASGLPYSRAATEYQISASTLARWDQTIPYAKIIGGGLTAAQWDAEAADVLRRLGKSHPTGVAEAGLRMRRQRRFEWMRAGSLFVVLAVFSPALAVVGMGLIPLFISPGIPLALRILGVIAIGIFGVAIYILVEALSDLILRILSPYAYAITQLRIANDELTSFGDLDLFRQSTILAKFLRHRYVKAIARAERQLVSWRLGGDARGIVGGNRELADRRNAANVLSSLEVQLQTEGPAAYPAGRKLIRTMMFLTAYRDWSLTDLPKVEVPTDSRVTFAKQGGRLFRTIVFLVGAATTVGGAISWIIQLPFWH